jgi:cysteine synthase
MTQPTPLIPIQLEPSDPLVWCKLEYLNPSGSTKDRIASFILDRAFAEGRITTGQTVIEASSGSTSIAFALSCALHGLRFIAVMPEGVSNERVLMIRAFGGEVRFTPKDEGVLGAISESERLAPETGAFLPRQFANADNALAHEIWTSGEILSQIPGGTVDAITSGVGTGGTLVGLYRGLRKANVRLRPFLARPVDISEQMEQECSSFSAQIPGVVEGVSQIFQPDVFEGLQTIEVPQEKAIETARRLILKGYPVGPSSGLNYAAAVEAMRQIGEPCRIVTVLPDRMERYFTGQLFAPYR